MRSTDLLTRPPGTLWTPDMGRDTVMPGGFSGSAKRGMDLIDFKSLGLVPDVMGGAVHGTHTASDVVTQTSDGRDLNQVWLDYIDLLNAVNGSRQALINFLTFPVTQPVELVAQPGAGVDFEDASEFGEPVGGRLSPSYFNMAYTFKWYDLAARYTWMYLADATSVMVDSVANAAVEAFYRKQLFEVFKCIFNNTNLTATINAQPYTVYKFYNNDGTVPPSYKNNTFAGSHNHYSGTATFTTTNGPPVIDAILADFSSHGYGLENGYRTVLMCNSAQAPTIRGFKSTANSGFGTYDFIPAQGQPGVVLSVNQQFFGAGQPAATLDGLNVIGSYGPALVVQDDWLPPNYCFLFVTGGALSLNNPVGFREHAQSSLRGLRLVKGKQPNYPLIDSFWATGFGTGIRQRGAGWVLQTNSASYTVPSIYS
jgi:hypothetical protein